MPAKPKKLKPSNTAQTVNDSTWYYERRGSIEIVHELRDKAGLYIQTDHIIIPWRKLMVSAQRCGHARDVNAHEDGAENG